MTDTLQQVIARLAEEYHKSPDGEGEYGCPGQECPGVERLTAFGLKCVKATERLDAVPSPEPLMRVQPSEVVDAAAVLVAKLREVHAHPSFQTAMLMAHVHGQPYQGPTYGQELDALEAALRLQPSPEPLRVQPSALADKLEKSLATEPIYKGKCQYCGEYAASHADTCIWVLVRDAAAALRLQPFAPSEEK